MAGARNSQLALSPGIRAVILLLSMAVVGWISWRSTGSLLPSDPNDALLVQSSILIIVLATLLTERYFTEPGDAFVNGLTALLTVLPLRAAAPRLAWSVLVSFLFVVIVAALVTIALQSGQGRRVKTRWVVGLQRLGFHVCSVLGRARVVYSIVFLTAIIFFEKDRGSLQTSLLIFWGVYIALWPLGIPELLARIVRRNTPDDAMLGTLMRIDSPDVARVLLAAESRWAGTESPVLVSMADGSHRWGVPLMSESRADGVLGTVLLGEQAVGCTGEAGNVRAARQVDAAPSRLDFTQKISGGRGTRILGLVREGSRSTIVRFELTPSAELVLGQLIVVPAGSHWAYFQVIDGETSEESFGSLNYGSQIASAVPVGVLDGDGVFHRAEWIPTINAPVFGVDPGLTASGGSEGDFVLGQIPGTRLDLRGDFVGGLETHTAILGATGSGKTELAFDLLKHAAESGVKVLCIDLTSQYAPRLQELQPSHLTISEEQARELGEKLFDAETGKFGAGDEKKVLRQFAVSLQSEVEAGLRTFLSGNDNLALVELNEISNTKATLWITEMYLSTLLKLAKDWTTSEKILVVIEEAHTVMPEASFVGLGDFDSKGTIAKITQLALQGRKYGVGLLILAQRTATVSKSVLTQCNTIVSFACQDDTSINFLRNVYGSSVAEGLPALKKLRAVAHGQWIRSELPVVFDVPFDQSKADREGWSAQLGRSKADSKLQGNENK